MKPITSIALVVNKQKQGATGIAARLRDIAQSLSIDTRLTTEHPLPERFLEGCDAVCVIGGDGTLLGVVPQAVQYEVRVLGVNLGKLGFLVTFSPLAISQQFESIMGGAYELESRSLLLAEATGSEPRIALNDIVVKQTTSSRLMVLEVFAEGMLVNQYACDGLIFSTPTGSTAYNLSAGGPIIHPDLRGIAITPICPHTLSNRSVLFPGNVKLEVRLEQGSSTPQINIDGQSAFGNDFPFPLHIQSAPHTLQLIHDESYSHFETLRTKLGWRESSL